MKAEDKLEEAFYFLEKLRELVSSDYVRKREEVRFNMSAFVQAWRNCVDRSNDKEDSHTRTNLRGVVI